MRTKIPRYECIGGPLCGKKMEKPMGASKFVVGDDENLPHFYRLIRIAKNDHSATATFFHYFGSNARAASKAHPKLLPPERLYRKTKKQ
jgi:hypothetical protein